MPDYKKLTRKKRPIKKVACQIKEKRLSRKAIPALIVAALILAMLLGARSLLMRLSIFEIKEVAIVNQKGKVIANPQDFLSLSLIKDFNLFSFDINRITQDIQARHPELLEVSAHKQFPHKLLIIVKERQPLAVIVLRENCLVDEEGFVLPFQSGYRDLPKIVGLHPKKVKLFARTDSLRLSAALNLLRELRAAGVFPEYKIVQIDMREYSNVVFYLADGIKVKMGQSDFGRKAVLLSRILAQLKAGAARPKYIDMRFDSPVVKP